MSVDTVISELVDVQKDYALIRDCVKGQRAVKARKEIYLPNPDPTDLTEAGLARNETYRQRAVFYGVTGRTLRGLVGLVFDKEPAKEIPALISAMVTDVDGGGMSLDEQAQVSLSETMELGRGGLWTDYPVTSGPVTAADVKAGKIHPVIIRVDAEHIINWRRRRVGAKVALCLVVIKETVVVEDDGFAEEVETQYRVLRLTPEGVYTVELYRDSNNTGMASYEIYTPLDGKGRPFTEIPFEFFGDKDNTPTVSRPPLLDIAELNVKHYCNSADYEESVFMLGQPTPVFAGLTKQWVDDVMTRTIEDGHGNKKRTAVVGLGARGGISLPVGGTASLLQVEPNTLAFEAMTHKEQQMIALGAKLIENVGTQQTATEATIDSVLDNSVLATAARNVSKAYRRCLGWAHQFVTGDYLDNPDLLDYELSTDFAGRMLTAQDRAEIVGAWVKGAITWTEMRWNLKRAGTAFEDDEDAKDEIGEDKETAIDFEAKAAAALAGAVPDPKKPAPGDA